MRESQLRAVRGSTRLEFAVLRAALPDTVDRELLDGLYRQHMQLLDLAAELIRDKRACELQVEHERELRT